MSSLFAEKVAVAPDSPGVYLLKDGKGRVIYVGKARVLRERLRSYLQPQPNARLRSLVGQTRDVETVVTRSEKEALILEENFIKMNKPRFNVRLRDDKKYPYLKLTVNETFPRLFITRDIRPDGSLLFGPYTRARDLRRALQAAKRVFRLRTCRLRLPEEHREQPCLNFQVKRCLGPCTGAVSESRYRQVVDDVVEFLSGRSDRLTRELERRMWRAARAQDYEQAARLRDQWLAMREVSREQQAVVQRRVSWDVIGLARGDRTAVAALLRVREGRIVAREEYVLSAAGSVPDSEVLAGVLQSVHAHSADVPDEIVLPVAVESSEAFAELFSERRGRRVGLRVARRGERAGLLQLAVANAEKALAETSPEERVPKANRELADLLGLTVPPRLIEGVDISNTQGTNAAGSVVVFRDDQPLRSEYRRFRIRGVQGPNDYAMIEEALARRLRQLTEANRPLPDLVLVDGGQGQLSAAMKAYREFGSDIPILGLAKRSDTLFYSDGRELTLPLRSAALKLLKRIRDESHRFAITYHRRLRRRSQIESVLDTVRGLGEVRKRLLLRHFGSPARLKEASPAEIARVRGFGRVLAEKIYRELHS
ncbi:MAG: excinuclease ABC subunit UvrC [candidate division WOR-3 bacterium]